MEQRPALAEAVSQIRGSCFKHVVSRNFSYEKFLARIYGAVYLAPPRFLHKSGKQYRSVVECHYFRIPRDFSKLHSLGICSIVVRLEVVGIRNVYVIQMLMTWRRGSRSTAPETATRVGVLRASRLVGLLLQLSNTRIYRVLKFLDMPPGNAKRPLKGSFPRVITRSSFS